MTDNDETVNLPSRVVDAMDVLINYIFENKRDEDVTLPEHEVLKKVNVIKDLLEDVIYERSDTKTGYNDPDARLAMLLDRINGRLDRIEARLGLIDE